MRLFQPVKLLGLVLALTVASPIVTDPFQSQSVAAAVTPLPRRTGDPDTPEWTTPSPGPLRPASHAAATAPVVAWRELLLRVFRGVRIAG